MPFVKLDCGMLNSTLWFEREARDVFITALLMAEPYELKEPTPQIHVDSLELTGWVVPVGWYGFVQAAGVGILARARVEPDVGIDALKLLGMPDTSSRTPDFDGRRLVRVDGGYVVLNFIKYRDKDATGADRQRRWRERQKQRTRNASLSNRNASLVTIAEAEAEAEEREEEAPHKSNALRENGSGGTLLAPWDEAVDEALPPDPVADATRWFLESYRTWYAEERHGARYHSRIAHDYEAAKDLVATWPERDHLEAMARIYLRSDKLGRFHNARSIVGFTSEASGIDAHLRSAT